MTKINKLITVDTDDVTVLAAYALMSKNLVFKHYVEKMIKDKAKEIRKKNESLNK